MRNLTPVIFDDEAALRAVVPRKQLDRRIRLNAALNSILARYAEYTANTGELSGIAASVFVEPEIADLKSLYSGDTVELAALKKMILDNQQPITRSYCQYCAIGEPRTFDHYASKGRFPEFAMFSLNLIPCCGTCNLDKGEAWTEKGHRHFINFYYDTFLQHVLLHADLKWQSNGDMAVVFTLRDHPQVTATEHLIIRSHFVDLDLFQRYAERATGLISEVRSKLPGMNMRIGGIVDYLVTEANIKANHYGQNYWQAAVYRCLAASGRFVEECLGNGWLQRARAEVAYLLELPVSAATSDSLHSLIQTRAWRLYVNRGLLDGNDLDDWFMARAELGVPHTRWV